MTCTDRVRLCAWTAVALLVLSGTVRAEEDASATTAPPDPKAKVCKKQPPPTGSHIGERRICKTQAEWDQASRDAAALVRDGATKRTQYPGALSPNRPQPAAGP